MDLSSDSHVVMGEYCLDLLPVIVGDLKPQMVWTSVFLYIISDSFVIRTFLFGISRLVCNRNEVSYGCIIRWTTLFPQMDQFPISVEDNLSTYRQHYMGSCWKYSDHILLI